MNEYCSFCGATIYVSYPEDLKFDFAGNGPYCEECWRDYGEVIALEAEEIAYD